MTECLGFVGTGHIAAALIDGLLGGPAPPRRILVSPRNAAVAAALARRHPAVSVAADNQAVADGCDLVVLAVRPQVARAVVGALRFGRGQRVISVIAPVADQWLEAALHPARLLARALPMPPVARRRGPIAFHPPSDEVAAFLSAIGTPMPLADREALVVLWSLTGLVATHYGFLAAAAGWAAAQGVPAETAQRYAALTLEALSADAARPGAPPPADLARQAQTPGGLNEQVMAELGAAGWFERLAPALDGVLRRLHGAS